MKFKLGVLGAGNMAEAIVRAALSHGLIMADQVILSDPDADRRRLFESLGMAVTGSNQEVVTSCKQLLLAVKPQILEELGESLSQLDETRQIVLSIMAGVPTGKIEQVAGGKALRLIRLMPNTPLMVGRGMTGLASGEHARDGDDAFALRLFGTVGEVIKVSESDLDAITAVSGSGPAYLFYLAEAMQEAACSLGLTEHARLLAQQTLRGAARLLCDSEDSAAVLRQRVTSPGGTTEAAITHMENQNVRKTIIDAIGKAHQRSRELGQ